MAYLIATDSRKRDETLFMVDRNKQKKSFWSNQICDALIYKDKNAAEKKAASLLFNNPRVVSLGAARCTSIEQALDDIDEEALSWNEAGWDGHKNAF